MIERSQAEIEADDLMLALHLLRGHAFYSPIGFVQLRIIEDHLYAMHKLRDEKLYRDIEWDQYVDGLYEMQTF